MQRIVLIFADTDYKAIQDEIILRLKQSAAGNPDNSEHAGTPDEISKRAGAVIAECVRELNAYRERQELPEQLDTGRLVNPERLRDWRVWRGFSLGHLSKMLACTISEASQLERGRLVQPRLIRAAENLMKTK